MPPTFVVSDLHLQDQDEPFLFNRKKEETFVRVVDEALRLGGRLVFNGDIFDLTSMMPPRSGLAEFFEEVLTPEERFRPAVREASRPRAFGEMIGSVLARFPAFARSVAGIARGPGLDYVVGNHDLALRVPENRGLLESALGLAPRTIRWHSSLEVDGFVLVDHGNEFDPSNRTGQPIRSGYENRGEIIASVIYRAVMPALRARGAPSELVSAMPAVRPEEEIVLGLEHLLGEEQADRLLEAFVRLLSRNGYFAGPQGLLLRSLTRPGSWRSKLFRALVSPARVRASMPRDHDVMGRARRAARRLRLGHPGRTVVLGHTHELDSAPGYVNLGTWVDHVRHLSPAGVAGAERSLPVLKIESRLKATLLDASDIARSGLEGCQVLWSSA